MNGDFKYIAQVRENREIEYEGLTFYPLTVRDFELYRSGQAAWELMMSSLPPKLARLSWCAALEQIDRMSGTNVFFGAAMNVLARALKLECATVNGRKGFLISTVKRGDALEGVFLREYNVVLTMQQMDEVRRIIALQNDYQIPNENWNPDLVADVQYTQAQDAPRLKAEIEDWVYSVAVNSGEKAEEIWSWPIRKLKCCDRAIERTLGYQIYTLAGAAGLVKFKHGAPYPTWRFDKKADLPGAFKTMGELEENAKGQLPEAQEQH